MFGCLFDIVTRRIASHKKEGGVVREALTRKHMHAICEEREDEVGGAKFA